MLYDCFLFFNELDLLEIRLNHLNSVADKFVLVEMGITNSGNKKPFYFEENKKRYKDFLDKIVHIKVTDYPDASNVDADVRGWLYENYQRDCIMRGLKDAKDDDIVMISDLDEIPSLKAINEYSSGVAVLKQKMMYYYLNNLSIYDSIWTKGTKICHYSDLVNPEFDVPETLGNQFTKKGLPTYIRFYTTTNLIEDGGWHFSYLGGPKAISYKIKSFAHQELNKEIYTDEKEIERRVRAGEDIFDRAYVYKVVPLDDSFPEYILKNKEKYKHLIAEY